MEKEIIEMALERLIEVSKEVDGIKPQIIDGKLLIELSNGMNLELSNEEINYQAFEHLHSLKELAEQER
jgi:hypothetical protein